MLQHAGVGIVANNNGVNNDANTVALLGDDPLGSAAAPWLAIELARLVDAWSESGAHVYMARPPAPRTTRGVTHSQSSDICHLEKDRVR